MTAPPRSPAADLRPLRPGDAGALQALVLAAGARGVYVGNDVAADGSALARRSLGLFSSGRLRALAWFGGRANLVLLAAAGAEGAFAAAAAAVAAHPLSWRIALGPLPVLEAVCRAAGATAQVLRPQLFYEVCSTGEVVAGTAPVRSAVRADLDAIVEHSLALNRADLELEADATARRWVRDTARARIRSGTTFVVGPVGAPFSKLDIGSDGPSGTMIEGVFTVPEQRGRRLAADLVAAIGLRYLRAGRPRVCLHVAAANEPARRCYERAGMRAAASTGLLLRED